MKQQPPKYAQRLLRWFCQSQFLEEIEYDLDELFEENLKISGARLARNLYWRDVFRHVKPFFLRNPFAYQRQNSTAMWSNYLKIALRNFWRSKVISSINVLGLSLGLACCLMVFFHIKDELSYDQFLDNGDQIYRVLNKEPERERPYSAGGPIPLGPTLKEEFAGIRSAVRLWRDYQPTLTLGDKVFQETNLIFTDQDFFEVISFPLKQGNPKTALDQPNTIVLTQSMATKYFGKEDPMGKTIQYNGGRGKFDFLITGVMDDLPHNTHFKFDFLASFLSVKRQTDRWGSFKPIWTYVTLEEGVSPDDIRAGLPDFAAKYVPGRVRDHPGYSFDLEPLDEIYMSSKAVRNMRPLGDLRSIYVFGIVGISILLIACINFINLSMAKSLARAKEVGVRKTIGARRQQLIGQFITESGLTVVLSLVLAVGLSIVFLPVYNDVTNKAIGLEGLLDLRFISIGASLLLGVSLLSGVYPALFISRMKATDALKKGIDKASANLGMRKVFVIFQFMISAVLIIGILVTKEQMTYMYSKPLGIDKENVLVVPFSKEEKVFFSELTALPEVVSIGVSQRLPVNTLNYDGRTFSVEGSETAVTAQSCVIDEDFVETYDIEIVAGRNHFKGPPSQWEFLINESAAKNFGWGTPENALGKTIFFSRSDSMIGPVIGVFKDYHLESLHEVIPPMIMFRNALQNGRSFQRVFTSVKFKTEDLPGFLNKVEDRWKSHNAGSPYFSFFIDDSFDQLHDADHRFATIFNYVTFIALFIACLGLLGLSMLTVDQKTKEIGIRKALGASVLNVTTLLSKGFLKLILVGLILASPVAYYLMDGWLNSFSYRTDFGIDRFLLAFVLTLLVSLLTISFQTIKAALGNPVNSLRDE
ncbi:MAG: FtsX-like permease family protein [Roseivirga sp.]|nr:FtsX-like permease family protein [Roseivirga sp.]